MSWAIINHIDRGLAADRPPANAVPGKHWGWFATDSGELSISDGSTWITIGPGGGSGVSDISKTGDTPLTGSVTLSEGANITLTQTGQDIEIASSGGGGGSDWSVLTNGDPVTPELIFDGNGDVIMVETL